MAESSTFWMVRLRLNAVSLAREGRAARLPRRQEDVGVLVHAVLAGLFGEGTLQPFHVLDEASRRVPVLAYSQRSRAELCDHAATFADPARYEACALDEIAAKPMPEIEAGRLLGFTLRACPVVRLSGPVEVPGKDGTPQRYRAGAEVDAWIHQRFLAGGNPERVDRAHAYRDWLAERLRGAAELRGLRLEGFRRVRLARQTHSSPRAARVLERPDAVLRGNLAVLDGAAFRRVLTRGVGRHRAFGYGMLLLEPTGQC